MKAVAIDDEPLALSVVECFSKRIRDLDLVATFTNSKEGLKYVIDNNIELLFLDINMPHLSGIELARMLPKSVNVIFTTAYQDYALVGFELQVVDYLLKPFSFERFEKAVIYADKFTSKEHAYINIKSDYINRRILVSNILYIEGLKDYVKLFCSEKTYVTKLMMKTVEQMLSKYSFCRIHRSFIINVNMISSYNSSSVELSNGISLPIGVQYKSSFLSRVKSI